MKKVNNCKSIENLNNKIIKISLSKKIEKMSLKKQYKKKKIWSNAEESVLCDIWATKIDMLRGARKNSHILEEMRLELDSICGIIVTKDEIKTKIHNLTSRYR